MIKDGLKPIRKDERDYSFHRTFGAVVSFADEYNVDAGLTMPNQDEENAQFSPPIPPYPYGCTDYAQTELCIDEDKVLYRPDFTESIVQANADGGADIRVSLASLCQDGAQREGESADLAVTHRRGAYFNVEPSGDFFDGIRSAILQNGRSVSIGTPWFNEWRITQIGIIADIFTLTGSEPWHNWKICGWKTFNGVPYLIGKTWQGKQYGDNGVAYFSRETINKVMAIPGTAAFTVAQANPQDILTIKTGLLERALYLLQKLYALILRQHA